MLPPGQLQPLAEDRGVDAAHVDQARHQRARKVVAAALCAPMLHQGGLDVRAERQRARIEVAVGVAGRCKGEHGIVWHGQRHTHTQDRRERRTCLVAIHLEPHAHAAMQVAVEELDIALALHADLAVRLRVAWLELRLLFGLLRRVGLGRVTRADLAGSSTLAARGSVAGRRIFVRIIWEVQRLALSNRQELSIAVTDVDAVAVARRRI
mmetsp:Transcript_50132/g.161442  ORF Transcript_50132/g.161442 Transcript_50132/m.161442 type:complete len:209 (+) Transcript_50132:755-1381(+)